MKLHILGIGGTFMNGIAVLAKQAGHVVTGSDLRVYPPMSTQLSLQGILLKEGYEPDHIEDDVDLVIVGNVIKRGNPAMEEVLLKRKPYISGPQWLAETVLHRRHVLAVAGTHGKTTTTSLLAWIIDQAGFQPGFLVGGIPENFGVSARLGQDPYFVIEADEYDSAFFDKRSKFLHYRPSTAILNNLEFDHADIFPNLDAIKNQFHLFVRTIPGDGLIIHPAADAALQEVLERGCWSKTCRFGVKGQWTAELIEPDGSVFSILVSGRKKGEVHWGLIGLHNVNNALAALAAADHIQVPLDKAMAALSTFKNVKRRLEVKGHVNNIVVYDDFAHHPTAISTTLAGLRAKIGPARLVAVLEFGSYTMRTGVHKESLQKALTDADVVVCKSTEANWGLESILSTFKQKTIIYQDVDQLVAGLVPELKAGDHVIIMSNSGFGGVHQKLIDAISLR